MIGDRILSRAEAEDELRAYGAMLARRDVLVLRALEAGVSKTMIWRLTGIARTTVDAIEGRWGKPAGGQEE